jgi:hypothetical protein
MIAGPRSAKNRRAAHARLPGRSASFASRPQTTSNAFSFGNRVLSPPSACRIAGGQDPHVDRMFALKPYKASEAAFSRDCQPGRDRRKARHADQPRQRTGGVTHCRHRSIRTSLDEVTYLYVGPGGANLNLLWIFSCSPFSSSEISSLSSAGCPKSP